MANLPERSPFAGGVQYVGPQSDDELEALSANLQRAECGDPAAQYWVASKLRNDFNSRPDWVAIYKWYTLATEKDYAPAAHALKALDQELPDDQIELGRDRASDWQPRKAGCAAQSATA